MRMRCDSIMFVNTPSDSIALTFPLQYSTHDAVVNRSSGAYAQFEFEPKSVYKNSFPAQLPMNRQAKRMYTLMLCDTVASELELHMPKIIFFHSYTTIGIWLILLL